MRTVYIRENEAGQRLDKYLHKYLKEAPDSFLYKMLRKKNITRNGKKALGSEKLEKGDEIRFFMAEETLIKFGGGAGEKAGAVKEDQTGEKEGACLEYHQTLKKYGELECVYESRHILIVNKPVGMLTQKADKKDLSLNEWLIGRMLFRGEITQEELRTFKPSVCNRLDRNTSGMVICGKTLAGSREMSRLLKDGSLHKYYLAYVKGEVKEAACLTGVLVKDEAANTVFIRREGNASKKTAKVPDMTKGSCIQTRYEPVAHMRDRTLLKVELLTGKTHQIRAHLASCGHPVIGDCKYGDPDFNRLYRKKYGIRSQLLHAYLLKFPAMEGEFEDLSGRTVKAAPPEIFTLLERQM